MRQQSFTDTLNELLGLPCASKRQEKLDKKWSFSKDFVTSGCYCRRYLAGVY